MSFSWEFHTYLPQSQLCEFSLAIYLTFLMAETDLYCFLNTYNHLRIYKVEI